MSTTTFRDNLKNYLRTAGISQKQLARELALRPTTLSHKLNETDGMSLSEGQVKQIVLLLAKWRAILRQAEAVDLLHNMAAVRQARQLSAKAVELLSTLQS